jgi:hypothetical protein
MKIYFYLLITFLSLDLSAQTYTYYDENNGLSELDGWGTKCISSLSSGAIWVGTENGLFKLDNGIWEYVPIPVNNSPGSQICVDMDTHEDTLWLATQTEGLWKFTPDTAINYNHYNSGLPFNWMRSVAVDTNGVVWMSCEGLKDQESGFGLTRFDGQTWTNYNVNNSTIGLEDILEMGIDGNNHLWMLGDSAYFRRDYPGSDLVRFNGQIFDRFTTANSALLSDSVLGIGTNKLNKQVVVTTVQGLSLIQTDKQDTMINIPIDEFEGDFYIKGYEFKSYEISISSNNHIWGFISYNGEPTNNPNSGTFHLDPNNNVTYYDSLSHIKLKYGAKEIVTDNKNVWIIAGEGILVMDFNTSIAETSNKTLKAHVFPNPASDVLNVAINTQIFKPTTIKLYNHVGKLVYQETTKQQLFALPINQLKQGVYVINITAKNLTPYRQKVLILNP